MTAAAAVQAALVFAWVGLVVGISFIEAPLKFQAPKVTLAIGLGIGRLVFRALNTVELALAVAIAATLVLGWPSPAWIALALAIMALLVQVFAVRPGLTKRSNAVLAAEGTGEEAPRSRAHHAYVVLEVIKLAALVWGGVLTF